MDPSRALTASTLPARYGAINAPTDVERQTAPQTTLLSKVQKNFHDHPTAWKIGALGLAFLAGGTLGAAGYYAARNHHQVTPPVCNSLVPVDILPVPLTQNCTVVEKSTLAQRILINDAASIPIVQTAFDKLFAQVLVPTCAPCFTKDIYKAAFNIIALNEQELVGDNSTVAAFETFEQLCCSKMNHVTDLLAPGGRCTSGVIDFTNWINFVQARKAPYMTFNDNSYLPDIAQTAEQLGIAPPGFAHLANATIMEQVRGFEELRKNTTAFLNANPGNETAILLQSNVWDQLVSLRVGQVVGEPYFQNQTNTDQYPQNAIWNLFQTLYRWSNSSVDRMDFEDTYWEIVPYWSPDLFYPTTCYLKIVGSSLNGNGTAWEYAINTLDDSLRAYNKTAQVAPMA